MLQQILHMGLDPNAADIHAQSISLDEALSSEALSLMPDALDA